MFFLDKLSPLLKTGSKLLRSKTEYVLHKNRKKSPLVYVLKSFLEIVLDMKSVTLTTLTETLGSKSKNSHYFTKMTFSIKKLFWTQVDFFFGQTAQQFPPKLSKIPAHFPKKTKHLIFIQNICLTTFLTSRTEFRQPCSSFLQQNPKYFA